MSRQLTRIRSLVSQIEEIQRQGRLKSGTSFGASESVNPVYLAETRPETPSETPIVSPAVTGAGRVSLTLKHNVVVELQVDPSAESPGEIVEIKKAAHGLEILFRDGKAFHIPFKNVA